MLSIKVDRGLLQVWMAGLAATHVALMLAVMKRCRGVLVLMWTVGTTASWEDALAIHVETEFAIADQYRNAISSASYSADPMQSPCTGTAYRLVSHRGRAP